MKRLLALMLSAALAAPSMSGCAARSRTPKRTLSRVTSASVTAARPQAPASAAATIDAWRSFVATLPPGTRLTLTLKDGRRIKATLLQSSDDALVVTPRTRVPEPVQTVRFADLAALDLEGDDDTSVAKAAGIGVVSGVGAFLAMLLILIATIND